MNNKVMKHIACMVCMAAALAACEMPSVRPASKGVWDSVLVAAHIVNHGQYYPNIGCNVLSVDMLSRGLEFDSLYHISGSGVNLYLSDVFVPLGDTVPASGIYTIDTTAAAARFGRSSPTSAAAYTIVPATDFRPGMTGAYLLRIDNGAIRDTMLFSGGEMTVTQWADSLMMQFALRDEEQNEYRAVCVTRM